MPGLNIAFLPFLSWFRANGGILDENSFGLTTFNPEEGGRGAVALKDIPESHVLFTIPRSLTLSTRSSRLPSLFGIERWIKPAPQGFDLDKGWAGLILCMMWEEANHGRWAPYLASLPNHFETPMFWSEEDLAELKGSSVVDKLGKADAEREYHDKLLPAIQSRKDIFFPHHIPSYYTLERFHIHGSRILSRSFTVDGSGERVPEAENENEEVNGHSAAVESSHASSHAMDVDELDPAPIETNVTDSDEEDEIEGIVSMVPMADMLNARYGSENAKLFYEEADLRMVTTKPIKAGEQIFNTYGDLPNAELLRRYGHVDLLPLPKDNGWPLLADAPEIIGLGNPGDVVEIRADIVVDAVISFLLEQTSTSGSTELLKERCTHRIDWWLEAGGDDVFVFELPALTLPEDFISLIRLLLYDAEWEKAQEKEKPPKAKLDRDVLTIVSEVIQRRSSTYDGSLEDDEAILSSTPELPLNKKNAVIVRLGEKRILRCIQDLVQRELDQLNLKETSAGPSRSSGVKRKGDVAEGTKGKKSKV